MKNRKKSCTGNYRHINICYFFSKDRVESNKMSVAYCSTEHMLAYFFAKALQRALFTKFCSLIMEWKHLDTLKIGLSSTREILGNVVNIR